MAIPKNALAVPWDTLNLIGACVQISIVMPTFNGMKYIEQAVASILSQAHGDWELIISDDGSSDGTRQYLSGLRDPRIKVHFQPANLGIFGNLNFLFAQASCGTTQILCQDDYFVDSGALDRLLKEWSALPAEIAFMRCNHLLDSTSSHAQFEGEVLPPVVDPDRSDLYFYIFGCVPGNLSNVSVRTGAIQRAGWFRTDMPYSGDFEFWSRLGRSRPWAISRTSVTHIRSHAEQASRTLNRQGELLRQMHEILEGLYRNLVRSGYSPMLLRLEGTMNYVSRMRDDGIRRAVRGQGISYLRKISKMFNHANFCFGGFLGWLIYFGCLGGRVFTNSATKRLLSTQPSSH